MSVIDGKTKSRTVVETLDHIGSWRQADTAARVHAEALGTIVSTDSLWYEPNQTWPEGHWETTVEYAPWA